MSIVKKELVITSSRERRAPPTKRNKENSSKAWDVAATADAQSKEGKHFQSLSQANPQLDIFKRIMTEQQAEIIRLNELGGKLAFYERDVDKIEKVNSIKERYFQGIFQSTEFGVLLGCTRQKINHLRREKS